MAPFVLENLGCSGDEARLVDCPVEADTEPRDYSSRYDYYYAYSNPRTCDPFDAGGGTFARVACGSSSAAGPPASCSHARRPVLGRVCPKR